MSSRIFVPADSAALSVGADAVASALAREARLRGVDLSIVRTGSRGLFWLEPLIEVETREGRVGYGPVTAEDAASLFDAGFLAGGAHPKALGRVEQIPYLARQQRLVFARCGVTDPLSLEDYRRHAGFKGLERALDLRPEVVVDEIVASGLRGRGGAGFPTGVKWGAVGAARADRKYVVCNADEGDSGTFADRMLMEGDPFLVIEGMTIAAVAVGATMGYVYIRSEYPHAFDVFSRAVERARAAGVLGPSVLGSAYAFDIEPRLGAGAYICGEETSMLESLEGKRGQVRAKPPLPALSGLFGKPTVINNMLSFASVPWILEHGAKAYAEYGVGRSLGSQPFQLAGNVRFGGLIELAFGPTIRELVEGFGGGTRSGRPVRAVQIGGPLGAYFPQKLLDMPLDYEFDDPGQGHAGPWRDRRLRRHGRHDAPGALRPCLLRQGKLREMHALPHRFDPRRRDCRQDHRRPGTSKERRTFARSLRGAHRRFALRAGRTDAIACSQRARAFRRRLHPVAVSRCGGIGVRPWPSCRNSTSVRRSARANRQ